MTPAEGDADSRRFLQSKPSFEPRPSSPKLQSSSFWITCLCHKWYPSKINRPIETHQHLHHCFYIPASIPRDMQAFFARQIPLISTLYLLQERIQREHEPYRLTIYILNKVGNFLIRLVATSSHERNELLLRLLQPSRSFDERQGRPGSMSSQCNTVRLVDERESL